MMRRNQTGYALVFTIGIVLVSTLVGLAYLQMGTLESALVTDAASWTQSLDTGEAAMQGVAEMVRASRAASSASDTCRGEFNPFSPRDVTATNDPDWHSPCSATDYVDRAASAAFAPGGNRQGLYRASVEDVQNIERFESADASEFPSIEYRTGKPPAPRGYRNTKFFVSAVGQHPSTDRPEQRRRLTAFAGLPAGLGRDQAMVAGSRIVDDADCLATVTTPFTFDLPAIGLTGGGLGSGVASIVFNGQAPGRLGGNGDADYNGVSFDPMPRPSVISSCDVASALFNQLLGGLPVTLPRGGNLLDLAALVLGSPGALSEGSQPVLPPGLFEEDANGVRTINPFYFTGRSPADSPGIVEIDGDVELRPGRWSGPGTYPGQSAGRVALDGGDLGGSYLRRGNVILAHGDIRLRGGWQTLERAWSPLADRNGIERPIDVVLAADEDITVDADDEGFLHVRTGRNTRLVLIAGRDVVITGDLFLTDLNVVAVAGRDVVLRQRTTPLGVPLPGSVLSHVDVSVPTAVAFPALLSQLRGTLVAGRDLHTTVGWHVSFDEAVVNGNMSTPALPSQSIADFDTGTNGFLAFEDVVVGDLSDLPTPETTANAVGGELRIGVATGDPVTAPSVIVPLVTTLKLPHPVTGREMLSPIRRAGSSYFVDYSLYGGTHSIAITPGQPVRSPFNPAVTLRRNRSQGETVMRAFLAPQDWSPFRTLSLAYSSNLADLDVVAAPETLPPPLESKLPAAALILEDLLGNRMVYPLPGTGGAMVTAILDLFGDFLGERDGLTPMTPVLRPYGAAAFNRSAVTRIMVRINHAGGDGMIRLANVELPGNAGAEHNLPFPFRYEFYNWQVMAAN